MKKRILPVLLAAVLLAVLLCSPAVHNAFAGQLSLTDSQKTVLDFARDHGISYFRYPAKLLRLLENNPETKDFVLQYPLHFGKKVSVDLSEYRQSGQFPLFLQWDQRWGYIRYGGNVAGLTGCGPVCLAMAGFHVTGDDAFSPDKILRFARRNGYYSPGNGSKWTLISEGGEQLGLHVTELPLVEKKILDCLAAGLPIICAMGPGDFTAEGHYIVLFGLEDGLLRIHDPNSIANSQCLWRYEDICGQIRNLWAIEKKD